jgi:membrane-associated phospholipid phosphatase
MAIKPRQAVIAAFATAVGLAVTWLLAFQSSVGGRVDELTLHGFVNLRTPLVDRLATPLAHLGDPKPFLVCGTALVVIALLRGRRRTALMVPTILLAANLTTQHLKPLLADPRVASFDTGTGNVAAASFPSGHATATMALALCLILVVPARWRPTAAVVGAAFSLAVTFSLLTLGWHYPSDVLGGFLVAATFTLAGVAVLLHLPAVRAERRERPEPAPGRFATYAPLSVGALLAAWGAVAIAISRPDDFIAYAQAHTVFVVGATLLALTAGAIATAFALALRRG